MKYLIVGGGPTGLSLGYSLIEGGHHVTLIEKNSMLGGSWNSQYVEGNFWSENSPRVLASSYNSIKLFLEDLNIDNNELSDVYGSSFTNMIKIFSTNIKYCTISDNLKIINTIFNVFYKIDEKSTVKDWLDKSTLTDSAKKFITILSITINDIPEKTNLNDFINALRRTSSFTLKQFKDSNKWHKTIENKLIENNNSVLKNTEVVKILEKDNYVYGVITKDKNNVLNEMHSDNVILCCQSSGLLNILQNSSNIIKNNWMNYELMHAWCKNTYYSSFGFQLHFYTKVKFPNQWCWSCDGDWNIIILPVTKWLNKSSISLDNTIKTIWSCCVVNMNTKSKRIGKTLNECNKQEAIEECIYQINNSHKLPNNYKITFSEGLEYNDNKWQSNNTGFTRGNLNFLPMKGKINNLFALGCFNEIKRGNDISHMGSALDSSIEFLNTYEPHIISFHNKHKIRDTLITICKIFITLFIYHIFFYSFHKKIYIKFVTIHILFTIIIIFSFTNSV